LTAQGFDEDTGNGDPATQWRSLCERFHEIRLAAYRYNLQDTWRRLVRADPDNPVTLTGWQQLDEQISRLDKQESQDAVRYGTEGSDDDNGTDSDDWDDWGDEYSCALGRCDRKVRSFLGLKPRCELFNTEMKPLPARPEV